MTYPEKQEESFDSYLYERGIVLLELCVAVTVVSLLLAAYLSYAKIQAAREKYERTETNLAIVQKALQDFWMDHRRYPCPASPVPAQDGRRSFKESDCRNAVTPPLGVLSFPGYEERRVSIGYVPLRTLGLSDSFASDGWRTPFVYAVSSELTQEQVGFSRPPYQKAAIRLIDEKGELLIDPPPLYVLLSMGENRVGILDSKGLAEGCEPLRREGENCDSDATFIKASYSRVNSETYFDDLVVHDRDVLYTGDALIRKDLERMLSCQRKGAFYDPDDPESDDNGCLGRAIPTGLCREGLTMQGVDSNGQIVCVSNMQSGLCRGGEILIGYNDNGEVICSPLVSQMLVCAQQGLLYAGVGAIGADASGCRLAQPPSAGP